MRLALFTALVLLAGPAFAAMSGSGLVNLVVYLIIVAVIIGILLFLVDKAPFIPGEAKAIIKYVIYFVAAIAIINLLLGLAGHPIFSF
jgi:hypothetical protein